ncbi:hypothetical protein [Microbacterium sp.]|uniref:hypothetical protein n=1 Tax=Microbacterium sp. TaxID=51671 RepID=UPI00273340B2|nr:hypothetical protein [Microbacterium sp.]MDP3949134.1 hypothetical protein [Microbacterium sp.]
MSVEPDPWWTRLVDVLGSLGVVEEREPYGLVVCIQQADGTLTVVEIVMTRDEWDSLVSIPWGELETAVDHVRGLVLNQPPDQRYLVYDCYDLVPSEAPHVIIRGRGRAFRFWNE